MEKNKVEFQISPETASGHYSNLAIITHSYSEFILDFVQSLPGMPKPTVASRVLMTPEHAKRLLKALLENVQKYESQFGEIRLRENNAIFAPMGGPKAEA